MPYSVDLRERVISAVNNGMRATEAAKIYKISRRVIYDWFYLHEQTNKLEPKSGYQKGHSHKITDWDQFKVFVEKHKHCASPQMRIEWQKLTGIEIGETAMLKALKKIGYTSKKKLLTTPKQIKKSVKHFWKKSKT